MKQKITTLLLCFAMALSLCTFFTFGAAAQDLVEVDTTVPAGTDTWGGKTEAPNPLFAGGDGSAENPWQIDTANRLAYLGTLISGDASYADDCYILTANIDLAGKNFKYAIGRTNTFTGTFDGGNFTVYNLGDKMFQSFSGTVQNLKLINATGIFIEGIGTSTIKNCNFQSISIYEVNGTRCFGNTGNKWSGDNCHKL